MTIWKVTGDTFPHKDRLHAAGMVWIPSAKAWMTDTASIASTVSSMVLPGVHIEFSDDVALSNAYMLARAARQADAAAAPAAALADAVDVSAILSNMKHRDLVEMARALNGGTVGVDSARKDIAGMVAFILARHGEPAVRAFLLSGATAPAPAPAAPVPVPAQDGKPSSGGFPPRAADAPDAGAAAREMNALRGALAALKDVLTPDVAPLDEARVREIATEAVAAAGPGSSHLISVSVAGAPVVEMGTHTHPMFGKVLRLVAARLNVSLIGPAGCGKTTLAHHVATALGARRFACISGAAGVSESQVTGRLLPIGAGGAFSYVPSDFVDVYENGGVVLLDEFDAFDPNMLLVLNSALANGGIYIESRRASGLETYVPRHADCYILAASNTFGVGASVMYAGRNAMDAATIDRFYCVELGYDAALEQAMIDGAVAQATDTATKRDIVTVCAWVLQLREMVASAGLRRVVSTRAVQKAFTACLAGIPSAEVQADLVAGWSRDERSKAGVA